MSIYLTSDLTGEDYKHDEIKFVLSEHYNSIPFSSNIGIDPNIVNDTSQTSLKFKLRNIFTSLGYNLESVKNSYGRIEVKLKNGEGVTIT